VVDAEISGIGQILKASPEHPFLAQNLRIYPEVISALLIDMAGAVEGPIGVGISTAPASEALIDAWARYMALAGTLSTRR
jgi:hypothetical protein